MLFALRYRNRVPCPLSSCARRHVGAVKPAVDERHDGALVFGIFFGHRPIDARLMCSGVAEHAEGAADQICEPALLAPFAYGG